MRVWVVDQNRSSVLSESPPGISVAEIGDLAHWVEPGDILAPYTSKDDFATCVITGAALVQSAGREFGVVTINQQSRQLIVKPSSGAGRSKWRRNVQFCLDVKKVFDYGILEWLSSVYPEQTWDKKDVKDGVGWAIRFDPDKPRGEHEDGYVYLMKGDLSWKIGKSRDPQRREKEVSRKSSGKVGLHHVISSNWYSRAEWELHQQFKTKCAFGEWFYLEPEDVDYICGISAMNY